MPGILQQAAIDLQLDLRNSFIVGDKVSDLQTGVAVGCSTILVRTGYGEKVEKELSTKGWSPDYVAANLLDAVSWILARLLK